MAWQCDAGGDQDDQCWPVDDLKEHVPARNCWCRPAVMQFGARICVVHHALDGRERAEPDRIPEMLEPIN